MHNFSNIACCHRYRSPDTFRQNITAATRTDWTGRHALECYGTSDESKAQRRMSALNETRFDTRRTNVCVRVRLMFCNLILVLLTCISGHKKPPLCSSNQSSWLQTQRCWVRFPALPDFLNSIGSGTGSTRPREDK
jgi:hypothetical protein